MLKVENYDLPLPLGEVASPKAKSEREVPPLYTGTLDCVFMPVYG